MSVLLIVAILMAVVSRLLASHNLVINQHQNVFEQDQALQYVLGAEVLAQEILRLDEEGSNSDHLEEQWAQQAIPFELDEGGFIEARIVDLHSCFNLNTVVTAPSSSPGGASPAGSGAPTAPGGTGGGSVNPLQALQKLMNDLEIPTDVADAWKDWIDIDEITDVGAEGSDYLLDTPPHLAPNRPVTDVSELRLVKGIEAEHYQAIRPHVCIRPGDDTLAINVNTASEAVLAALSPNINPSDAQAVVENPRSFDDLGDFVDIHQAFDSVQSALTVNSNFFLMQAEAQFGESRVSLETVLERSGGTVTVIQRDFGKLFRSSIEVEIDPS